MRAADRNLDRAERRCVLGGLEADSAGLGADRGDLPGPRVQLALVERRDRSDVVVRLKYRLARISGIGPVQVKAESRIGSARVPREIRGQAGIRTMPDALNQ